MIDIQSININAEFEVWNNSLKKMICLNPSQIQALKILMNSKAFEMSICSSAEKNVNVSLFSVY